MQTAIMTIFQFTPEEVVEIRVGVGGEEMMSRSGRISGVEVVFVVRCNVVVIFRVIVICNESVICDVIMRVICFGEPGKACESDNQHPKDKTRMKTPFLNSHNESTTNTRLTRNNPTHNPEAF